MKNYKIKFIFGVLGFFFFWGTFSGVVLGQTVAGTTSTTSTTTVTEFIPTVDDGTAAAEERKARLLLMEKILKGQLPDSVLYSIMGQPSTLVPATTNTNSTTVSGTGTSGTDVFTKNLKLGDTDAQVLLLQKALNEDTDTVVSVTGVGSAGNETTYFGAKTKAAVVKLQEKHRGEVLTPNGLSSGTGYFGASTRALMNSLSKSKVSGTQPTGSTALTSIPTGPVAGLGENVVISSLEPNHGSGKVNVIIHGSGITKSANKIIAGSETFYNVTSTDGKTLAFTMNIPDIIPANSGLTVASSTYLRAHFNEYITSDFPAVKYPVCIMNDNGMSNCAFFIADI